MKKLSVILSVLVLLLGITGCKKEPGCVDTSACNFSPTAEEDDGSCYYPGTECDDGDSSTINDQYNSTCSCEGESPNEGCTDENACNFAPTANTDDGSCLFEGESCDDGDSGTINDIVNSNCECEGENSNEGCTDSSACNYSSSANVDDGSCEFPGDGCDDGNSSTINDTWSSSCNCEGQTQGCTDSSACNYDSSAEVNDGSCAYPGDACDDGDPDTAGDEWTDNCNCEGYSTESCAPDDNGLANHTVYFGYVADDYPGDNTVGIWFSADYYSGEGAFVQPVQGGVANGNNIWQAVLGGNGSEYTLVITDNYGDGITGDGYYFAYCYNVAGEQIPLVVEEWDDSNMNENAADFTLY